MHISESVVYSPNGNINSIAAVKNWMKFPQKISQAWTVVLLLEDLRQEDGEFEANLNNSEILLHKTKLFKV